MQKKLAIKLGLLVLLCSTIFATCKKNKGCIDNRYGFSLNAKVVPDFDSIQRGDTLLIDLKEPVTLPILGRVMLLTIPVQKTWVPF